MLNQLMPFNQSRFDQCMLWFSKTYETSTTLFEMVKLHVMTDVYHVLDHARPVIGGALERWPYGPVVKPAYKHVRRKAYRFNEGLEDSCFIINPISENVYKFSARPEIKVDEDDFSQAEILAMRKAWKTVMGMEFQQAQDFFHSPAISFMGKAWEKAEGNGAPIDWNVIIDAYDEEHGEDHAHVKTVLASGL